MKCTTFALPLMLAALVPSRVHGEATPPVELFRASFDRTLNYADHAFGETRELITVRELQKYRRKEKPPTKPGKFGTGLFEPRRFEAHGNVCVRRGTICFWYKQEQVVGDMYYPILEILTVEPYFWWRYLSVHGFHGKIYAEFMDRDCVQHMLEMPGVAVGQWQHIAVAWDCLRGIRLFMNGKRVANDWGKCSWPVDGMFLEQINLPCRRGSGYDELRIFSDVLAEREVGQIYENRPIESGRHRVERGDWKAHRLEELGWQATDDLLVLRANEPMAAVSVPVQSAKGLKRWVWRGVDGRSGTYWPSNYQGYSYQDGGGYHLELGQARKIDYLSITGHFRGDLFAGTKLEKPLEQERLLAIEPRGYAWTHTFEPPLELKSMSFFKRKLEGEQTGNDNTSGSVAAVRDRRARMCNLQMFEIRRGSPKAQYTQSLSFRPGVGASPGHPLGGNGNAYASPWHAQALVSLYGFPDRGAVLLRPVGDTGLAVDLRLTDLRAMHLFTPATKEDLFLDAVTLDWRSGPSVLRVQIHDPVAPRRELASLDVRTAGSGSYELTLDHVDTIIPQGRSLWITLVSDRGPSLAGFRIELHLNDRRKVLAQYETRQMGLIKDVFMFMSEPRPWSRVHTHWDAMFLGRRYKMLGEMYDALHELHKHVTTNKLAEGIHVWTHPSDAQPRGTARLRAEHQDAPAWAAYAHLCLGQFLDMAHWWIDNRQVPNGEFGSNLGDDSDLVQDWPSLALIADPDRRIRNSLNAVGNACWERNIESGINRRTTDALHAYEEGLNVMPHQALLDYGNPVYLERLMEAARTVEEKLMGRTANGHLHFRSWYYGSREVVTELKYGVDTTTNTLMLHPAMYLTYYNRNPRATAVCSEYVRAWLEDFYEHGKQWPGAVRFESHEILSKGRHALTGYGFLYLLNLVHDVTKDERIIQAFRDAGIIGGKDVHSRSIYLLEWFRQMGVFRQEPKYLSRAKGIDLGSLNTGHLSDPRYDWKYLQWALTNDKDALAQAARRLTERMSVTLAMQTEAEQSADRVQLSKKLIDRMYLGGVAVQRNELYPRHAVSYEGLSRNFAALVLDSTPKSLRVLFYSFEKRVQKGRMRMWCLENGTYRVRFGPDADQDDRIDEVEWEKALSLRRYSPVDLALTPRRLMLIEIDQTSKGDDLFSRPDLAITSQDAELDGDALTFVVHNVGSAPASNVTVEVQDRSGKSVQTFEIPKLEAPLDLHPRRVSLTLKGGRRLGPLTAIVDPADRIPEICEENNQALFGGSSSAE